MIVLFLLFIFYSHARSEIKHIRKSIFLEMKNYSLSLDDAHFEIDVIVKDREKKQEFYTLYEDENSFYILVPFHDADIDKKELITIYTPMGNILVPYSNDDEEVQKVWYAKTDYAQRVGKMQHHLLWQFVLFIFAALLVSLLAAWYTLKPLRSSLRLLEDFIKDIIHDLNTPLTSILLNLKMIETENEEIQSIRTATETIEMLHHNLDSYLREQKQAAEMFDIGEVLDRYVVFFTPLYDYLNWDVQIEKLTLYTDKEVFERIIYNLLSNACKYNTSDGKIKISLNGTVFIYTKQLLWRE